MLAQCPVPGHFYSIAGHAHFLFAANHFPFLAFGPFSILYQAAWLAMLEDFMRPFISFLALFSQQGEGEAREDLEKSTIEELAQNWRNARISLGDTRVRDRISARNPLAPYSFANDVLSFCGCAVQDERALRIFGQREYVLIKDQE